MLALILVDIRRAPGSRFSHFFAPRLQFLHIAITIAYVNHCITVARILSIPFAALDGLQDPCTVSTIYRRARLTPCGIPPQGLPDRRRAPLACRLRWWCSGAALRVCRCQVSPRSLRGYRKRKAARLVRAFRVPFRVRSHCNTWL